MDQATRGILTAASLLVAVGGCGSKSSNSSNSADSGLVTQTGRAVTYTPCASNEPLAGATVTIGSRTATTAADGTYSIQVPSGTPFTMTATAPNYIQITEAEDSVTTDYDRGDTRMILSETASFFTAELPSYVATGGILTIELVKTAGCTDVGGTTIQVSPSSASALMQYPSTCSSPVGANPYAADGTFPNASAAVVYNLTPGTYTLTATSPSCTQIPYPYTDPTTGLTYEGTVTTIAAGTAMGMSFARVFLK
jgi:hypothetical protein